VIVYAYRQIGRARKAVEGSHRETFLIWVLGVALFTNTIAFFGIAYFDQSIVAWFALLAMIAVVPTITSEISRQDQLAPTLYKTEEQALVTEAVQYSEGHG
jgi:hypothetical protein